VRELYARLRADGIDTWLDEEDLLPGQDWDAEIRKAIRGCCVVIVCLSSSSVSRTGYLQKEIRFVLDAADEKPEGTIFLIPARLEAACEIPERLRRWQWVDLFDERGYERLMRALEVRLGPIHPPKMKHFQTKKVMERLPNGDLISLDPDVPGYATIQVDDNVCIAIDPHAYDTLGGLLDDLYVEYLQEEFQPYRYGDEWILREEKTNVVPVPLEWAERAPCPLSKVGDGRWQYETTPAVQRIVGSSQWIISRIKPSDVFAAMAIKDERILKTVLQNRKLRTYPDMLLSQVAVQDIDRSAFPYKVTSQLFRSLHKSGTFAEIKAVKTALLGYS
jgi:hypothetical protein